MISLNIAFKPSAAITEEAIKISNKLASQYEHYFVLDGTRFYPHLTCYSAEFPEKNLDQLKEKLKDVLSNVSAINFDFTDADAVQGWIGVNVKKTPQVQEVHSRVLNALNELREGHIKQRSLEKLNTGISEDEKNNINKYGSTHVAEIYKPHLTLIRLKDHKEAEEVAKLVEWRPQSFICSEVGLYESSENGTCIKLLEEYKLK